MDGRERNMDGWKERIERGLTLHRFMITIVFLAVFLVHFFSPVDTPFDSRWSVHTALSLVRNGDIALDEYEEIIANNEYYAITRVNGHLYTVYPLGTYVLAAPVVWLVDQTLSRLLHIDLKIFIAKVLPSGVEVLAASVFTALCAVFIYLIGLRLLGSIPKALLLVFVFAFCTPAWSTASRGLWQHGPTMLLLAMSLYFALRSEEQPAFIIWMALPLALSFTVRPSNVAAILPFSFFVLARHRSNFPFFCGLGLAVGAAYFALNHHFYGEFMPPLYHIRAELFSNRLWLKTAATHLLSPSRGLFVYCPVFFFSLIGLYLKARHSRLTLLDWAVISAVFLHFVIVLLLPFWNSGHSYGPRFFTDMVPYYLYFLVFFLQRVELSLSKPLVLAFALSIALSFAIHFRGAFHWGVYRWNHRPINVDEAPDRVWDFSDIQFLRGEDPSDP